MYRTSRKIVPEPALSTREKESRWDEKEERKEEREKKEEIVEWSRLEAFRRTKGATDDALDYDQNKGTRETSFWLAARSSGQRSFISKPRRFFGESSHLTLLRPGKQEET